jgi:hypothetical protein
VIPGVRLGSLAPTTPDGERLRLRKRETFGFLDRVCQQLELTPTQLERAERAYETIGQWLSEDPALATALVYVQGSAAIGTTNKPINDSEHDVDAVCLVAGQNTGMPPAQLKKLIGDRLREHKLYRGMLEEKTRCWRLNYAGDFHLDLTPSIKNPRCAKGGELVPDKALGLWKPSNPRGYRDLFASRADLLPEAGALGAGRRIAKADVEPFPEHGGVKGVLRRTVQLSKRHRDVVFEDDADELAPLSIIITTLASQAYVCCVQHFPYDNELDLLCDTVRAMPWFIEIGVANGRRTWAVPNETTDGENFAEKWNKDAAKARAFYQWHEAALADFESLAGLTGTDAVNKFLGARLGDEPVAKAMAAVTAERGTARAAGRLNVASGVGLTTSAGTSIRANTFFGR